MKGIILAAGRGSRLGELGEGRPKCLIELEGRPLLDWQRTALAEGGVDELAMVGGYCREQLPQSGVTLFENPRWSETGIVASLLYARPWLEREPCLVSYADIIYDAKTIRQLAALPSEIGITSYRHWRPLWELRFSDPLQDAESFAVDSTGHLRSIGQRAQSLDEIEGQYMGLLKFTPAGFAEVLKFLEQQGAAAKMDMTSLLRGLVASGVSVSTVSVSGLWYEVDNAVDAALFPRWRQTYAQLEGATRIYK